MSILVLAEHNNMELKTTTLNAITAASQINQDIDVLVVGSACENVTNKLLKTQHIKKIILVDNEKYLNPLAEFITPILVSLAENYSHIIAPASTFGKNIMPRLGALIDVSQVSDVIKIEDEKTFVRPIYAGNALATVESLEEKKIITIRPTSFEPANTEVGNAIIEKLDFNVDNKNVEFISREETKSDRPELGSARIVVSGGRGLGSAENFALLNEIADKLNAAVGASRAAVDAGYISNDSQVGQTGKVVVPDLYIAVGISGAIQHLAGMKESKIIVAINKDEEAPIFNVSDYGLHADLFEALPQLSAELDKLNTIQK